MRGVQLAFPFRGKSQKRAKVGLDLIGRSYAEDDYVTVTVIGICQNNEGRVLVRRRPGGTFSMPVWLMRSIFREEERKMARVA
jgi:hypothetical protein